MIPGQAFIMKKIADSIIKKVMDKRELKKIQDHEKRIKLLEKYSHRQADFVCMDCGCKAKRVEKIKKRRK